LIATPKHPPTRRSRIHKLAGLWNVHVAGAPVCPGHSDPLTFLTSWIYDRPAISLVLGPRGGGKSYLSALATHVDSIRHPGHGTKILGGSLAQSQQVYGALRDFDRARPDAGFFASFTKTAATYATGSEVSILAASPTSVRGPHVPTLRLDEVDEIDTEIRESAMGMCMARGGLSASVSMTSTWHRLGGPMGELIEKAREPGSGIVHHAFCTFEILERCPAERSGPAVPGPDLYERCPECPIKTWCHSDVDAARRPKAKRSAGHYAIDSLVQKVRSVSLRTFEADYLCSGPKADGLWFPQFDPVGNVSEAAEYNPALPVVLAIDPGVHTGAVWLQIRETPTGPVATVFADFYTFDKPAEAVAREILEVGRSRCNGRADRIVIDPAGGSRNPIGPTVIAEYERVGLRPLIYWPNRPKADGLALVDSFIKSADGKLGLFVHPRCGHLIRAFGGYRRAKRAGQWTDSPEDPNHPSEELMDSLRGGLVDRFPEGRKPPPSFKRVPATRLL
jgi:hypothetical protein